MRSILILTSLLVSSAQAGQWSSGGGDPLEAYFEEGRTQAADIVSRLSSTSLRGVRGEGQAIASAEWLLKNQKALEKELREMKFDWKTKGRRPKCAWTEYRELAPVEIHFPACRGTVSSKQEAGKLLIHEAAHHLGIEDHELATRLAITAYQAWENQLLKEVSFCSEKDIKQNVVATQLLGSWKYDAEIDGILGKGEINSEYFDPSGFAWTYTEDRSATKLFPGLGRCVYLAGWMEFTVKKDGALQKIRSPFVLAEWRGNPTVFWDEDSPYRKPGDDDFVKDLQPGFVMIAKGARSENDILFMGGDNNNQRLYAMRRVPVSPR